MSESRVCVSGSWVGSLQVPSRRQLNRDLQGLSSRVNHPPLVCASQWTEQRLLVPASCISSVVASRSCLRSSSQEYRLARGWVPTWACTAGNQRRRGAHRSNIALRRGTRLGAAPPEHQRLEPRSKSYDSLACLVLTMVSSRRGCMVLHDAPERTFEVMLHQWCVLQGGVPMSDAKAMHTLSSSGGWGHGC